MLEAGDDVTREQRPDAQAPQNKKPKDKPAVPAKDAKSAKGAAPAKDAKAAKTPKGKLDPPPKPPTDTESNSKDSPTAPDKGTKAGKTPKDKRKSPPEPPTNTKGNLKNGPAAPASDKKNAKSKPEAPVAAKNDAKDKLNVSAVAENVLKVVRPCLRWLGRVLLVAARGFGRFARRCFAAFRDFLGFGQAKSPACSGGSADTNGSSQRNASTGAESHKNDNGFDESAISQGFIGSVLGSKTSESSTRKASADQSGGMASRPVSKSVYQARRIAALVVAVVVVIAIVFGCRALVSSANHRDNSKLAQGSSQVSTQSKQSKQSKSSKSDVSKKAKPPKVNSTKAGQQKTLTDHDRTEILAKAQTTAAASGKPNRQYSYCVASRGDVGGNDVLQAFENTVFRTLNDQRGWPRAGATFAYRANSSRCDFTVYLSQASQMKTFSPTCSNNYSCCVGNNVVINIDRFNGATPQLLAAGMGIDRYRVMVINHETGHRLGHFDNDPSCPAPGVPAPLMQEQSMNLRGCTPNEWPTDPELWVR